MAERTLYRRADGKWAWRLTADNGKIIAVDGSQGYENVGDARLIADRVVQGYYSGADKKIVKS